MKKDVYNLSKPQESIWLTEEYFKGTNINHIITVTDFSTRTDNIDFDILKKSLNHMIKCNDNFQIRLFLENGNIKQYLCDFEYIDFPIYEISSLEDFINEESNKQRAFNLLESPLYEFKIFKIRGTSTGGILADFHHLISDAFTTAICAKQFITAYNSLLNSDILPDLNPDGFSYIQYLDSEKEFINSDKFLKDKAYWDKIFETIPEIATIPSSKQSKNVLSPTAERLTFILDCDVMKNITSFCAELKISVYNFFMTVFGIYLGRVSRLDDFVIGTPILNRTNFREKNTPGMFISTVPFRINIDSDDKFSSFTSKIAKDTLSLLRHQKYSYQYILEDLRKRDSSIPNLYSIMLSYQISKASDESSSYSTSWVFNHCTNNDLDIHIYDVNDENILRISYDYNLNKYTKDDINLIHPRVLHIINQVLDSKDILIKNIDIITPNEKNQILNDFNNNMLDYQKNQTVIELFEKQVNANPNDIAIVYDDKKLTYKELNEKANALALNLICNNVKYKDVIGVLLPRSIELVISILGILKCGATYMPLFADYPVDRINYMIQNSNSKLVITNSSLINKVSTPMIILNNFEDLNPLKSFNKIDSTPNDITYIIYTSGSTGKPKGVQITSDSLNNFVCAFTKYFSGISSKDNFLSSTSISFDVSIFELFLPLLNGASLVLYHNDLIKDILDYSDYIEKNEITGLYIPPNILNEVYTILKDKKNIKIDKLLVGVEAISKDTLDKYLHLNSNMRIINAYGPTETTICCSALNYTKDLNINSDIVPIGKPLYNDNIYILDKNEKLLPIGAYGELYVTGNGVGYGYINNEEETSKSYIPNFLDSSSKKAYKTGDIGKWNLDGTISLLGRKDNQVKISGYRIELNEIDSVIMSYPNIDKSITTLLNIEGKKRLVSYFTSMDNISENDISSYLSKKLAFYMIPYRLIKLDNFPLTSNGKIDKKALPIPTLKRKTEYVEPKSNIEKKLHSIWCNIFNMDKISIHDNFFHIGGDSLLCIRLSSKIYDEFNIRISLAQMFNNPTICDLSKIITSLSEDTNKFSIPLQPHKEFYPLSCAQRRTYYAHIASGKDSIVYNVCGGILLKNKLDPKKLESSLNTLIQLHSSFRTIFTLNNGEVIQSIKDNVSIKLDVEYSSLNAQDLVDSFPKPFDLSKAPLLRAKLYLLDDGKSLLLLDSHHIVVDGTSLSMMFRDIFKLYNGEILSEDKLRYVDYAVWEKDFLESDEFKIYESFWENKFRNQEFTALNLPYDYPLSATKSFKGDKVSLRLEKEQFNNFLNLAKENEISSYSLFLTALYILLYKYTSQEDLIIASPFAGRNFADIQETIGMFVNNIVLNKHIDSKDNFKELVKSIHKDVLDAISNQPYPYELLQKNLNTNNSLLDIMFTYQNQNDNSIFKFDGIDFDVLTSNTKTSKFNLWFEIIPDTGVFNLEYNTDLFKNDTAESLLKHYLFILNEISKNLDVRISDLQIITDEELKILDKFNDQKMPINDDTIISIFEKQVNKTPNKIAAVCDNVSLTYKELNRKANSLAHYLINFGIKPNDIVCIMTNRSLETIVAMLGILKAGAAFFNVDPTYPSDRTTYYIEDSNTKYVLVQKELESKVRTNTK